MEPTLTPEDRAFRDELRDFLAREKPKDWSYPAGSSYFELCATEFDRLRAWHRKLYDARFIGITWPEEYGGRNAPAHQDAILADEMIRDGAHPTVNQLGITLCAPALLHYGSDAQKAR